MPDASAQVWEPAAETFGPAGSLAEARVFHTATLLLDGRVLVVGGERMDDCPSNPCTLSYATSVELWTPSDE